MPLSDPADEVAESMASPKKEVPPASPQTLADPEHPWLGLESFREETRSYFFGRDTEIAELHLRLRGDPLLVLYGPSGLGKTSILLAGLIPRLRLEKQLPVFLRLRYEVSADEVANQLVSALFAAGKSQRQSTGPESKSSEPLVWIQSLSEKLALCLPEDPASRLWLRLHYRDEAPEITHLILDQFEEVFTLGAQLAGVEEQVRSLLAILLQGDVPKPISHLISEHDGFADRFDPESVPVRVILALRSDYVYALNRWRRHLPTLGRNSFELRALSGPGALKAVFNPGELRCHYRGEVNEANKAETGLQPIISQETAKRVVRFVAQKGEQVPIEDIEAVPPILSLLCRELNERRFTGLAGTPEASADQIIFHEGDADIETIISTFYERCLSGRPEAVRAFIEEEFVSVSGARLAQDEKSILSVFNEGYQLRDTAGERHADGFGDAIAARACLEELVNRRLLSPHGVGANPSYELIHDLLAGVVEKSRSARQERFEKEEAGRRAEAEKRAKEKAEEDARLALKRARTVVITVSAALAVAVLALIVGFVQYKKAIAAKHQAQDATQRAKAALKEAEDAKSAAEKAVKGDLAMVEKVAKQDPSNSEWQRDLSICNEKVGDVLRDQGDLAGALKSYRDGLAIVEKLSKQDPSNSEWQHDLAVSSNKVGDVLRDQDDLAGALKNYRDGLAIREKLAKQDPSNSEWQRDLAVSSKKVGDVLRDQGDVAGAVKSYRDGSAIREKLAYEGVPQEELRQRQDELLTRLHNAQEEFSQNRQSEPPYQYNIAGLWRAANGASYTINQFGNSITIKEQSPLYGVTAVGWGEIAGQKINIEYVSALYVSGKAVLRVSDDSRQITGVCSLATGQTNYLSLFR